MSFKKIYGSNYLCEIANINALKNIVRNWTKYQSQIVKDDDDDDENNYDPRKICQKYIKQYTNHIKISYYKSSKYGCKAGRLFCKAGVGIQSLPRIIRHTICDGLYIDLDFKNCHPTILQQLCVKNNIPCPYLTEYIENRKTLLAEWSEAIELDEDLTKRVFLKALNGNKTKYNIPDWPQRLAEIADIHKKIATLPEYKVYYEEVVEKESKNIFAKTVNRVLCIIENDCLTHLFACLDKRNAFKVNIDGANYKVCSLIFDGLQVPFNETNEAYLTPENFKHMSFYIQAQTGFLLEIDRKPFDEKLTLDNDEYEEDENVVVNDADAGEVIFKKYKNYMMTCDGEMYVKYKDVWSSSPTIVKSTISAWITHTPMIMRRKYVDILYNRDMNCVNKCVSWVLANWRDKIEDNPQFINEMNAKNVGYIPFKNVIYDTKTKKTYTYDECDVQFTYKISRCFPTNRTALPELMRKVINPCLPDEKERAYYLYRLARALAGRYEDKKWILNKGSRNCGKGVISNLLASGFDACVSSFNAGVFVAKKFENPDNAKGLSWVVRLRNKRLIICNEIDEIAELNGVMIKKLSGGDPIEARTNNKDEIEFVPQFTFMINCNNIGKIEPDDAWETCDQFIWKSKFVDKEELIAGQDFLKLKDDTIKSFIKQNDVIDAFILLVLDSYADKMEVPDVVLASKAEIYEDKLLSAEQVMLKIFVKSSSQNDKLFTADIINMINCTGLCEKTPSAKEISAVLQKIGCSRPKNGLITINGEKKSGYTNIKYVPLPVEEE